MQPMVVDTDDINVTTNSPDAITNNTTTTTQQSSPLLLPVVRIQASPRQQPSSSPSSLLSLVLSSSVTKLLPVVRSSPPTTSFLPRTAPPPQQQQQQPSSSSLLSLAPAAVTSYGSTNLPTTTNTIHNGTTTAAGSGSDNNNSNNKDTDDINITPRFNRWKARTSSGPKTTTTTTTTVPTAATVAAAISERFKQCCCTGSSSGSSSSSSGSGGTIQEILTPYIYYIIYAIINVIISVPGLYGYTAIIFNHPIFLPYRNTLSKLVIFSSLIHQLSFTTCSTIHTFAIGTVQDAGLIFLSTMANLITNTLLLENGMNGNDNSSNIVDTTTATTTTTNNNESVIVSTVLVLLSFGTATLGAVLILMGHFRLADAVSYLPMPVIGGYLAFIGYFCLEAGVGLAISESIISISDWTILLSKPSTVILTIPTLLAGFILTYITRNIKNDVALPFAMIVIPGLFYCIIFVSGIGMDGARAGGWIGDVTAPVPVTDLFHLVDFSLVRWDLIPVIFPTWVGMVFVVSFASCLDVAAIAMDVGEALDTNMELKTVGIGNLCSGLTLGFTGSYIFSQTIFTYRTGVHSRWIGILIIIIFGYVIVSPINMLEVVPLFFLGSTLVFIGYDLLYEWLFEIRSKIFLSEYAIVWATFLAIQIVGMDAGIVIGVLVSIVDHVVHSAKTTGVSRVNKRSRAVWTPEQHKLLQDHGYHFRDPKIITLEVSGNVFFGSSLGLLQRIIDELGIDIRDDSLRENSAFRSPHVSPFEALKDRRPSILNGTPSNRNRPRSIPQYLTIDLSKLNNLDASACRGCFLQLVRICAKSGISVCACNASARIEWMLRSHDVAYDLDAEQRIKHQHSVQSENLDSTRLLLFVTIHEALEFCEVSLVHRSGQRSHNLRGRLSNSVATSEGTSLAIVFSRILGSSSYEAAILNKLNGKRYHQELEFRPGQDVFLTNTHSDAFFVVLKGAVAVKIGEGDPRFREKSRTHIASGAGLVRSAGSVSNMFDPSIRHDSATTLTVVTSIWPVGGVFGYVDFLLERTRHFHAVATQNGTIVAKITMTNLRIMQSEDPVLDGLVQRVLLQSSLLDLANCTCEE